MKGSLAKNLLGTIGMLAVTGLGLPDWAEACYWPPPPHELDETEQQLDSTPPGKITELSIERIGRGVGPDCSGTGWSSTSIDGYGGIRIKVTPPEDDRTGPDDLGYRVEVISGEPPEFFIDYDFRAEDGFLNLVWDDGATDDQESLDFQIAVRAIDLGGNVGERSDPLEVLHPGSSGCASTHFGPMAWVLVVAGLILLRRRIHKNLLPVVLVMATLWSAPQARAENHTISVHAGWFLAEVEYRAPFGLFVDAGVPWFAYVMKDLTSGLDWVASFEVKAGYQLDLAEFFSLRFGARAAVSWEHGCPCMDCTDRIDTKTFAMVEAGIRFELSSGLVFGIDLPFYVMYHRDESGDDRPGVYDHYPTGVSFAFTQVYLGYAWSL